MGIRTFQASSSKEAIAQIYKEIGPDARILSRITKSDGNGGYLVEITATSPSVIETITNRIQTKRTGEGDEYVESKRILQSISIRKVLYSSMIGVLGLIFIVYGLLIVKTLFKSTSASGYTSVAVLPFDDLTSDQSLRIETQIIEKIIRERLSSLNGLNVVSKLTSHALKENRFKPRDIPVLEGKSASVSGSVSTAGEQFKIEIILTDISDDIIIGTKSFYSDDAIGTGREEEILRNICNVLSVDLGKTISFDADNVLIKPEARRLLSKARSLRDKQTKEDLKASEKVYIKALELEPEYAEAHAGLAACLVYQVLSHEEKKDELRRRAWDHVEQALKINPELSDAFAVRALLKEHQNENFETAGLDYQQALRLNPSNVMALIWYSDYLRVLGMLPEAIEVANKAISLDFSVASYKIAAECYYSNLNFERAKTLFEDALDLESDNRTVLSFYFWAAVGMKENDKALELLSKLLKHYPDMQKKITDRELLNAFKKGGIESVLTTVFGYTYPQQDNYNLARYSCLLGDIDQAFKHLSALANSGKKRDYVKVFVEPAFLRLKDDKRFKSLEALRDNIVD